MAKGLKDLGVRDLRAVKVRTIRQHALGRIGRQDRDTIVELVDRLEAHIVSMEEKGGGEYGD